MVASTNGSDSPLLHDATLHLIEAAVNSDPNPLKGAPDVTFSEGSALIPSAGPEGTLPAADYADILTVPGAANSGGSISVYVVKPGDSLSEIASANGITVNTILWANSIKDPSTIKPGDSLVILPVSGLQHTVRSGETLASIAKKYNADAEDIASFNGLSASGALAVGDELIIPGGELPKSVTTTKTPAKSSGTKIKTGGSLADVQANPYRGGSGAEIDGYYANPVPGARVSQGIHGWNGVDLAAPNGTPIYASAAGTVIVSKVGGWNGGYGNYVVIDHGNGTQTLYSHMSSDSVSIGQSVSRGQKIGTVGKTGEATGYHLHFEVRGARNPFANCSVGAPCTPE